MSVEPITATSTQIIRHYPGSLTQDLEEVLAGDDTPIATLREIQEIPDQSAIVRYTPDFMVSFGSVLGQTLTVERSCVILCQEGFVLGMSTPAGVQNVSLHQDCHVYFHPPDFATDAKLVAWDEPGCLSLMKVEIPPDEEMDPVKLATENPKEGDAFFYNCYRTRPVDLAPLILRSGRVRRQADRSLMYEQTDTTGNLFGNMMEGYSDVIPVPDAFSHVSEDLFLTGLSLQQGTPVYTQSRALLGITLMQQPEYSVLATPHRIRTFLQNCLNGM